MKFYLGTHETSWLGRTKAPLFLSYHRLWRAETQRKRAFRSALGEWALDSGGFTELNAHGRWTIPARRYATSIRRYTSEIGNLAWCAPQDWMVEDVVLQKTGLSVRIHQRKSVDSLLELRDIAPELPFVPVLQGWLLGQYLEHIDMYEAAGIDLRQEPLVCLGTMCRRQDSIRAAFIIRELTEQGLRCHALGAKTTGLAFYSNLIASSDSTAWSDGARHESNRSKKLYGVGKRMLPTCTHAAMTCNNCFDWAMAWRDRLLAGVPNTATPADEHSLKLGSRIRAAHNGALESPFSSRG